MANQPEISEFTEGVYQYETTDPIEGGLGGKLNLPWLQLANRTRWLYNNVFKLLRFNPKNRGYFTGLDIGGSSGGLSVSGNISAAVATVSGGGESTVLVTMQNSMGNTNYLVKTYIQSLGNITFDNRAVKDVFVPISATQFRLGFREISPEAQNLRIHIEVISLD